MRRRNLQIDPIVAGPYPDVIHASDLSHVIYVSWNR